MSKWATVWYNVTIRTELNPVRIGHFTSIGDGTSIYSHHALPHGLSSSVNIGKNVTIESGKVASARIAFGGMAGIPKRAAHVEAALVGKPWSEATVEAVIGGFPKDFQPMTDMRGSAAYRLEAAQNMLRRYFADLSGSAVNVLEVHA